MTKPRSASPQNGPSPIPLKPGSRPLNPEVGILRDERQEQVGQPGWIPPAYKPASNAIRTSSDRLCAPVLLITLAR